MTDFLLEIGCEEIPARFMPGLLAALKDGFLKELAAERISYSDILCDGTYRRLVVSISGLPERQEELDSWQKGPPARIGVAADGMYLPPALGFAKRLGVSADALQVREENGESFLYGRVQADGQPVKALLPVLVGRVVAGIHLPVAMRWAGETQPFVRPVQWVLCLFGTEVASVSLWGIAADRKTWGHRFLSVSDGRYLGASAEVASADFEVYAEVLRGVKVQVRTTERRDVILRFLTGTAAQISVDPKLVEEVMFLVEWPHPLIGSFDAAYLNLPAAVLEAVMHKHQKFFPLSEDGKIQNRFCVVADTVTAQNEAMVLAGYEKVLKARLEDARFFWETDRRVPFESRVESLRYVVFQKGLGSLWDKTERLVRVSEALSHDLHLVNEREAVIQTARLCKADLVTQMVYEFPELQGMMGDEYARLAGLPDMICRGISDHYRPRQADGDDLPKSITGQVVGIADRLDTIVCNFYAGHIPTGSQDPWGVRRAVYTLADILYDTGMTVSLMTYIDMIYMILGGEAKNREMLCNYMGDRFRHELCGRGCEPDCVDVVLSHAMGGYRKTAELARALAQFRDTDPSVFKSWTEAIVRIGRLAKKDTAFKPVDSARFQDPAERQFWEAFTRLSDALQVPLAEWNPAVFQVLQAHPDFLAAVARFFEEVLVMHTDPVIRDNRLALLREMDAVFSRIGNFERLEGSWRAPLN